MVMLMGMAMVLVIMMSIVVFLELVRLVVVVMISADTMFLPALQPRSVELSIRSYKAHQTLWSKPSWYSPTH